MVHFVYRLRVTDMGSGSYCSNNTEDLDYQFVIEANCGGGGSGPQTCGLFSYQFDNIYPDCGVDNGTVVFKDVYYNGATANIMYKIRKIGDAVYTDQSNNNVFINRSAGDYEFILRNQVTGVECYGTFRFDARISITASASNFQDVVCFNEPTGRARIDAMGSSTGKYYYSSDDGTTWTQIYSRKYSKYTASKWYLFYKSRRER
jgi:hypothetical protein